MVNTQLTVAWGWCAGVGELKKFFEGLKPTGLDPSAASFPGATKMFGESQPFCVNTIIFLVILEN